MLPSAAPARHRLRNSDRSYREPPVRSGHQDQGRPKCTFKCVLLDHTRDQ
jgi:hypothetical protein